MDFLEFPKLSFIIEESEPVPVSNRKNALRKVKIYIFSCKTKDIKQTYKKSYKQVSSFRRYS